MTQIDQLTDADRELLEAYIDFGSYKAAAEELERSVSTVKNRASAIMRKLEVASITQACIRYDRAVRGVDLAP